MKILVLGGTRFIGRAVTQQLHARGHTVAIFHRGASPLELAGVQEILGERSQLAAHRDEFGRFAPDVVIDMFAMSHADARQMVETLHGVARRSVVISSMDVYRAYDVLRGVEPEPPEPVPFDEDAPLRPKLYPYRGEALRPADDPGAWVDHYDKVLVERVALGEPALPSTILRLPIVYGPGDYQHRLFEYLKRMDDARPAIILDAAAATWQASRGYVENVAAAIVRAAEDERAANRVYNVADLDSFSEADWVAQIAAAVNWLGDIVVLPAERLPQALRFEGNPHQSLVADSGRIRRELGYREPFNLADALRRTTSWERAHPPQPLPQFDYAAENQVLADYARDLDRA